MSQISDSTAHYAPLHDLESVPAAVHFRFPAVFAIYYVRMLRYFPWAVQDYTDGPGGLTSRHRFYTAVQMEMGLRVTNDLDA